MLNKMLTKREVEVVRLVSQGLPNKAVARELGVREGTVKVHLHNIYGKLKLPNRSALILSSIAERPFVHRIAKIGPTYTELIAERQ